MPLTDDFQIPVSDAPFCAETDLSAQQDWQTPIDRFFVRSHFAEPTLGADHQISIRGAVARPYSLGSDQLLEMASLTHTVTIECAGNSRSYLSPPAAGLQFQHGAAGNASWEGVPLVALLESAEILPGALEVLFRGADAGMESGEHMSFERSLPLDRALSPDTIVAHSMNGRPLTRSHGFPARLIVPGWYGMASVKWLTDIEVIDYRFDGHFQSDAYTFINPGAGSGPNPPVTTMAIKSVITRPGQGARLRGPVTISGFAWSGNGLVDLVEVSPDQGESWIAADLAPTDSPRAWRGWSLDWHPPGSGHYVLTARARDAAGNVQPRRASWNYRGYVNNAMQAISVIVE